MRRMLWFWPLTLLVISGCAAIAVQHDYDPNVDFTRYQTFTWMPQLSQDKGVRDDLSGPFAEKRMRKSVAENETQAKALGLLIDFYETGDINIWDEYNKVWVTDTASVVDYINGFIEVYDDPLGYKGSYESIVAIKDFDMSEKMAALAQNAQYFEDNSPIMDAHKKENVTGVSYRVINVVMEAGSAAPTTPIGINLPNADWIRKDYGSKSVSLGNIKESYAQMGSSLEEFVYDEDQLERGEKYGSLTGKMHTALHEVIGN